MNKLTGKKGVKAIGYGVIVLIFVVTGYLSDKILLVVGTRNREMHRHQHPLYKAIYRRSSNKSKTLNLTKVNYGPYLKEGSFVNEAILNLSHHDDYNDFTAKMSDSGAGHIVWIFGDSWGKGIEKNETLNQTLQLGLDNSYNKIRIIANNSWSPLLMHMAYKDRIKRYNEIPDKIVIFIDQTDLGNDFCRHRPYVHRDNSGNLIGVSRTRFNTLGGSLSWRNAIALGTIQSGWHLLSIKIANDYLQANTKVPGFTICDYHDYLAWQMGKERSPNGTNTREYANYLQSTITEFVNYVKLQIRI